jgi:hypothetical protein
VLDAGHGAVPGERRKPNRKGFFAAEVTVGEGPIPNKGKRDSLLRGSEVSRATR